MNTLMRYAVTVMIAAALTLATFYLMHHLIDQETRPVSDLNPVVSVHFGPVEIPDTPRPREPEPPPEKPEPVEEPPVPTPGPVTRIEPAPITFDLPRGAQSAEQTLLAYPARRANNINQQAGPVDARPPLYPPQAARRHLEGWVSVEVVIDSNGSIRSSRVIDSNPRGIFDTAALNAVRSWRWRPRIVDGQPVEQTVVQRIDFALQD